MTSSLLLRCSTRWRQCKKKKAKIESPMRLSGLKESFVVKKSEDPYEDFKRSMIKMILEKQMFEISICIVLENLEYPENFLIRFWRTTKIHPRDYKSSNWFTYFFEVFKGDYESLGLDASSGKSTLMDDCSTVPRDILVQGATSNGGMRHISLIQYKVILHRIEFQ
ncbi:Transcription repressor OFP7 [Camellia lanceoleosa]|uniref:Transcription repressor OFP7 n=1 Tax=Camellia lanceoleosa TaxID=1840588 RepID=A0ACC0FW83_9ERIC|nr:Transcription repressor OFP7 [Camellia lanceoleosa]